MQPATQLTELEKLQVSLLNLAARLSQQAPQDEVMGLIADLLERCQALGDQVHG